MRERDLGMERWSGTSRLLALVLFLTVPWFYFRSIGRSDTASQQNEVYMRHGKRRGEGVSDDRDQVVDGLEGTRFVSHDGPFAKGDCVAIMLTLNGGYW